MKPYLRKTVTGILDWWSVISPRPFSSLSLSFPLFSFQSLSMARLAERSKAHAFPRTPPAVFLPETCTESRGCAAWTSLSSRSLAAH